MKWRKLEKAINELEDLIKSKTSKVTFVDDLPFYEDKPLFPGIEWHPHQREVIEQLTTLDRAYLVWSRRAGKDLFCWIYAVMQALKAPCRIAYLAPDMNRARRIIWEGGYTSGPYYYPLVKFPEGLAKVNKQSLTIRFSNGSLIEFLSANEYDKLRGAVYHLILCTEFAFCDSPKFITTASPALTQVKGKMILNSTLNGYNFGWHRIKICEQSPEWFMSVRPANTLLNDDGERLITTEMIQQSRDDNMTESEIRQEYFCEVVPDFTTHYFGLEMEDLRATGRLRSEVAIQGIQTHVVLDLGINDDTVLLFIQSAPHGFNVVGELVDNNKAWIWYINEARRFLAKLNLAEGIWFLPHDARHRQSKGDGTLETTEDQFMAGGANTHVLSRCQNKDHEINLAKSAMSNIHIDESCTRLIDCLGSYRREKVEKTGMYRPVHDWASHGADCFMGAVRAYKEGLLSGGNLATVYEHDEERYY